MKLNIETSNQNVNDYQDRLSLAALFPSNRSRQYGTRDEVIQGAGQDFLASIHGEIGDTAENEVAALKQWAEEQDELADKGLRTEINTSKELMPISDIVDRCSDILRRHPFGYLGGVNRIEDPRGAKEQAKESAELAE